MPAKAAPASLTKQTLQARKQPLGHKGCFVSEAGDRTAPLRSTNSIGHKSQLIHKNIKTKFFITSNQKLTLNSPIAKTFFISPFEGEIVKLKKWNRFDKNLLFSQMAKDFEKLKKQKKNRKNLGSDLVAKLLKTLSKEVITQTLHGREGYLPKLESDPLLCPGLSLALAKQPLPCFADEATLRVASSAKQGMGCKIALQYALQYQQEKETLLWYHSNAIKTNLSCASSFNYSLKNLKNLLQQTKPIPFVQINNQNKSCLVLTKKDCLSFILINQRKCFDKSFRGTLGGSRSLTENLLGYGFASLEDQTPVEQNSNTPSMPRVASSAKQGLWPAKQLAKQPVGQGPASLTKQPLGHKARVASLSNVLTLRVASSAKQGPSNSSANEAHENQFKTVSNSIDETNDWKVQTNKIITKKLCKIQCQQSDSYVKDAGILRIKLFDCKKQTKKDLCASTKLSKINVGDFVLPGQVLNLRSSNNFIRAGLSSEATHSNGTIACAKACANFQGLDNFAKQKNFKHSLYKDQVSSTKTVQGSSSPEDLQSKEAQTHAMDGCTTQSSAKTPKWDKQLMCCALPVRHGKANNHANQLKEPPILKPCAKHVEDKGFKKAGQLIHLGIDLGTIQPNDSISELKKVAHTLHINSVDKKNIKKWFYKGLFKVNIDFLKFPTICCALLSEATHRAAFAGMQGHAQGKGCFAKA